MLKLRKKAIKSTDKNTLLKFNSFGINYPDKMNEYIEFVEKLNIIIDNIYALDDLFYYFNFDGEKEDIITSSSYNQALRDVLDFMETLQKEFKYG